MKTNNQFKYIIAVTALLLASCTSLDEEPKSLQVSRIIRIFAANL